MHQMIIHLMHLRKANEGLILKLSWQSLTAKLARFQSQAGWLIPVQVFARPSPGHLRLRALLPDSLHRPLKVAHCLEDSQASLWGQEHVPK